MIPIISPVSWRSLLPQQVSELCTYEVSTGAVRVVFCTSDAVLEAPNWSPDGRWLVVNSAGGLFRVGVDSPAILERLDLGSLDDVNNDHVLSPDGHMVYVSSEGDGHLYSVPFRGASDAAGLVIAHRLSVERPGPFGYFVLGISPDGETLGVTGADRRPGRDFVSSLHLMPAGGGPAVPPDNSDTDNSDTDDGDSVGCSFSPDGEWLYFSSETGVIQRGDRHLFRMRIDGTERQQLTFDASADWFPQPSPDGSAVVYLAFPPGTIGHAANVPVSIRAMDPDGGNQRTLLDILGGQGTMNVSSWSPDGASFAFVAYPIGARS